MIKASMMHHFPCRYRKTQIQVPHMPCPILKGRQVSCETLSGDLLYMLGQVQSVLPSPAFLTFQ